MNYDLKYIDIEGIINKDPNDKSELLKLFSQKYSVLKDIYNYLQGKSGQYPNIDMSTMRNHFIKCLDIDLSHIHMSAYDVALR